MSVSAHRPYRDAAPSAIARRLLWHVLGVGHSPPVTAERSYAPLTKPGVVVLWLQSGQGEMRIGRSTFPLRPGPYCWLFNLRQSRLFTARGKPIKIRSIRFNGPGADAWLEELDAAGQPQFELNRPELIHRAEERIYQLVREHPPSWEWQAHDILHGMLREFLMARKLLSKPARWLPVPILQVVNAIEANPFRDWHMSELARLAGQSQSTFRAAFRQALNESPHHYLQRSRVDMARELLANPDLLIKEIAERLQFPNEDYFAKFFRRLTGVSPTHYRRHLGRPGP